MTKLSREEIETLLLLEAIGDGCPVGELAGRLGLCASLSAAVGEAARGLSGLVEEGEAGFRLSAEGRLTLKAIGL